MTRHLYRILLADLPRWRKLGWLIEQHLSTHIQIYNENRYPLFPCAGGCDQAIAELRFTAFGRCADCVDENDELIVTVH